MPTDQTVTHPVVREKVSITATRLANFLESVEAQEVLLQQRLTDAESRRVGTPASSPQQVKRSTVDASTALAGAAGSLGHIAGRKAHLYGDM